MDRLVIQEDIDEKINIFSAEQQQNMTEMLSCPLQNPDQCNFLTNNKLIWTIWENKMQEVNEKFKM